MRFGSSRSQIYDSQKTARAKWLAMESAWADAPRQEFEDATWEPLDRAVCEYLRAVDQLTVLFSQIRNEVEFHN